MIRDLFIIYPLLDFAYHYLTINFCAKIGSRPKTLGGYSS